MNTRRYRVALLLMLFVLCVSPAEAARRFYLASTGIQAIPGASPSIYQHTSANLKEDVDVTTVSLDILGIPWDEFRLDQPLPAPWLEAMDRLAEQVSAAGKPVFLQLKLANSYLTGKAVVADGKLTIDSKWSGPCYDFLTASDGPVLYVAYLKYMIWAIQKFDPRWINLSAEVNLQGQCDAAWDGVVEVVNAAYGFAKKVKPTIVAFPSFQLDALYGYEPGHCPEELSQSQCFDRNYQKISRLKRDRFAIAAYPQIGFGSVSAIPGDYFTRAAHRNWWARERIVIAETGWNSRPLRATYDSMCTDSLFPTSEAEQLAYFNRLTTEAQRYGIDVIVWWSNRDMIVSELMEECPCLFDGQWCGFIQTCREAYGTDPYAQFLAEFIVKGWGTLGIRDYRGVPKAPIYDRWQYWRGQTIRQ